LRVKRHVREQESDKVHHLIQLLFATAYYCLWKESLSSGEEDLALKLQAELEFRELEPAIREKMIVDSYLLNYIEVLEHSSKFDRALEVCRDSDW